jgi:hypothetical protein
LKSLVPNGVPDRSAMIPGFIWPALRGDIGRSRDRFAPRISSHHDDRPSEGRRFLLQGVKSSAICTN